MQREETVAYSMCTQLFEKIAREGRKVGLGLVLSSQQEKDDSDYGDYLCHEQKDRQAFSSVTAVEETDDDDLPF